MPAAVCLNVVLYQMRVSREVAALRDFEQSLLRSYQAYLKTLLAAATAKPTAGSCSSVLATGRVAVRCMGQLLVARPGFNYSSDLLQVRVMRWNEIYMHCHWPEARVL